MISSSHAVSEEKLKAAFIFNFIHFTRWQDSVFTENSKYYNVCLSNKNTHSPDFTAATDRLINGKTINIITLTQESSADKVLACHVLIIQSNNKQYITNLLTTIQGSPILTIGNTKQENIMIRLVNNLGKIKFFINQQIARESGIKFSSKILRLANKASVGDSK